MGSLLSGIGAALKLLVAFGWGAISWFQRKKIEHSIQHEIDVQQKVTELDIKTEAAKIDLETSKRIQQVKEEKQDDVLKELQDRFNSSQLP